MKRFFFCVLLAFCLFHAPAQDIQELNNQYLSIRDKLIDLKVNSEVVTVQLQTLSDSLKLSQQEAKQWEQVSTTLSENLTTINSQLNESYEDLLKAKERIKILQRTLSVLLMILAVLILVKAIFIILYIKGIPVPRLIDVIA